MAGGDPTEKFTNRTYNGKTAKTINSSDLKMVTETYSKMNGKPVIVALQVSNPTVMQEFEKESSAILAHFGVQDQALMDILTGHTNPRPYCPCNYPTT